MSSGIDPMELSRALIRCPSITPEDAGALAVIEQALRPLGFVCERMRFEEDGTAPVDNLWARLGTDAPNFCFAGHTDVVPPGDAALWSIDPFSGEVRDGRLWGRGASDMKAAIACFVAAVSRFLARDGVPAGSISLLITGDEEGVSINGTRKVLAHLVERGEGIDACLVGEPTNPAEFGEMMKIGRRGSMNAWITVNGVQGHSAYPHLADNPISRLIRLLSLLESTPLDCGTALFPPSSLVVTSVDVGNPATNVIPARATARLNIRFNDQHSGDDVCRWLAARCADIGDGIELRYEISGEPFLTEPGPLTALIVGTVQRITGREPELSTTGGTSDARFIKDVSPVCEFGMVGLTAHKVDENVPVADVEALTRVYEEMLRGFFAGSRLA